MYKRLIPALLVTVSLVSSNFQTLPNAYALPLASPTPTCTTNCVIDFTYQSANYYAWTAPMTGTYTFQAWGAQGCGGGNYFGTGGAGGYSKGDYSVTAGSVIYVYVGQQGIHSGTGPIPTTAYNGGGGGNLSSSLANSGCSGGGATHAATQVGELSTLIASQSSVLIVAGGGGGGSGSTTYYGVGYDSAGGVGGGTDGGTPPDSAQASIRGKGMPGTQVSGGATGISNDSNTSPYVASGFGIGASANTWTGDGIQGGGGGGGWYGGGAGSHRGGGGGGGSGYIGNLTNTTIAAGDVSFVQPDGSSAIGRAGNGYLRITYPLPQVTFNGFSTSGTLAKGILSTITASVSMDSKITFLANGKRIGGCISKATTGSGPYTATCTWKPAVRGYQNLAFYVVPNGGTVTPITTAKNLIKIENRANTR